MPATSLAAAASTLMVTSPEPLGVIFKVDVFPSTETKFDDVAWKNYVCDPKSDHVFTKFKLTLNGTHVVAMRRLVLDLDCWKVGIDFNSLLVKSFVESVPFVIVATTL